jgi:hypothetical protein
MPRLPARLFHAAPLTAALLGALLATGCVTPIERGDRQYVERQSAANVKICAKALVFARDRPDLAVYARDYVTLWPLDVLQDGRHALYLYGYYWSTIDKRGIDEPTGRFSLVADGRTIPLSAAAEIFRNLGFDSPPIEPPARGAVTLLLPATRDDLRFLASAADVIALRNFDGAVERYDLWEDRRSAIATALDGGP